MKSFRRVGLLFGILTMLMGCASTIEGVKSDIGKVGQKTGILKSSGLDEDESFFVTPKQQRISEIQTKLAKLGYFTGKADGNFNAATEAAIQDYQLDNGLRIDGRPTEKLREMLANQ